MTEPLLMLTHTILPPIDGKYARRMSKSTERHRREKIYRIAEIVDLSVTQLRRAQFIWKYGSEEIKKALDSKDLSIWKAYNIVFWQQIEKGIELEKKLERKET